MRVALHGGVRDGYVFWLPSETKTEDVLAIEAYDDAGTCWRYEPDRLREGLLHLELVTTD